MNGKNLHVLAYLLVFVGAINWGLIGLFDLDLVSALFGSMPSLVKLIYILVGLAGVYALATHNDTCEVCKEAMKKGKK